MDSGWCGVDDDAAVEEPEIREAVVHVGSAACFEGG